MPGGQGALAGGLAGGLQFAPCPFGESRYAPWIRACRGPCAVARGPRCGGWARARSTRSRVLRRRAIDSRCRRSASSPSLTCARASADQARVVRAPRGTPALSVRPRPGQDRALIRIAGLGDWFPLLPDRRAGRRGVKVEHPAGRTTLTPRCPALIMARRGSRPGWVGGSSGHRMKPFRLGSGCRVRQFPPVPGAQPYLGARSAVPGSGDMMRDGVPRVGEVAAAHSLELPRTCPGGRLVAGSRPQVHRFTGAAAGAGPAHAAGCCASSPSSRRVW
jgi:hypothetical protein